MSQTYEQPSTIEYIAVTARNQKLKKDIAAANIKGLESKFLHRNVGCEHFLRFELKILNLINKK